jgi:hypothetical protein
MGKEARTMAGFLYCVVQNDISILSSALLIFKQRWQIRE